MKLKIFFAAFINLFFISFPQNIIGCGPDADPYDYYTSFFSNNLAEAKAYQPFYYTGYNFLYAEQEPVNTTEVLAKEWAAYCGKPVTEKEALLFVTEYSLVDLKNLYNHIEKKQALFVAAPIKANSMTHYFIRSKDLEGLGYVLYAKQVEPYVLGSNNNWEAIIRDSIKMDNLMKNGRQLFNAAKTQFFKLKYGYQVTRLAHYSNNYTAAIVTYDAMIAGNKTKSVLQPMSLALKAGALYRTGKLKEAAYLFSKAFSESDVKRISNYISFNWAVTAQKYREEYLALCANNKEKAGMLALFMLGDPSWQTEAMQEVFQLAPNAEVLQVLAIREINKLEEAYLTPMLREQNGGKTFFYSWNERKTDSAMNANKAEAKKLQDLLHSIAISNKAPNAALFELGAAYTAMLQRNFKEARQLLTNSKQMNLSAKLNDQWQLTNLLLTVNEAEKIDAVFEQQILSSVQWLAQKALADKQDGDVWNSPPSQWKTFYRNFMSEIMAKRYRQQNERHKEALAVGAAEFIMYGGKSSEYSSMAADFLHHQSSSKDVENLYAYINSKTKTAFAEFIVANNSLKLSEVIDFAGTAYLRDNNFTQAIEWFAKSPAASANIIEKNPFIELLYDREERLTTDKTTTSKLAFAKEMLRLQSLAKTDKANAEDYLYKMALGFYNTTYYGYAWELVEYYRSGSDGYYIPKDATTFQKNYYGCFTAHDYFKMAMDASSKNEFKAKCLFMIAKCVQKQLRMPQYGDFDYNNWDKYESASKNYQKDFMNNKYFPQLHKEFGTTQFYQEVLNTCSYLRDFKIK
ncbi:MAG: hypothetical protein IPO46_08250 [Chitinophagaceae bacterium]|nr:MAG: hypothetical protein IPO46_08250 [Chitinophagaceae bacterium]